MTIDKLKLSIDTFELEIYEFLAESGYGVEYADQGDVEYALIGSIVDGVAYEPKRIWTVATPLTLAESETLEKIYQRAERKRRTTLTNYGITVFDYIKEITEDANDPTYAIAPGGVLRQPSEGGCSYPGIFEVRILKPTVVEKAGIKPYIATFTMKELRKVLA